MQLLNLTYQKYGGEKEQERIPVVHPDTINTEL